MIKIEINPSFKKSSDTFSIPNGATISITPPIGEEYYLARVLLFKDQAIQIFPKFFTIGCGFAQEEDWNTNLPLSTNAEDLYQHIRHNKRYAENIGRRLHRGYQGPSAMVGRN